MVHRCRNALKVFRVRGRVVFYGNAFVQIAANNFVVKVSTGAFGFGKAAARGSVLYLRGVGGLCNRVNRGYKGRVVNLAVGAVAVFVAAKGANGLITVVMSWLNLR